MTRDARAAMQQKIGDYEILDKIAEGGMGSVYKARHLVTGELVAIKVLPPTTSRNPILLRRLEQEYRAVAGSARRTSWPRSNSATQRTPTSGATSIRSAPRSTPS